VADRSVSVPMTLKGGTQRVNIFGQISIITPKRFDLERQNLVWQNRWSSSVFLGR